MGLAHLVEKAPAELTKTMNPKDRGLLPTLHPTSSHPLPPLYPRGLPIVSSIIFDAPQSANLT